MQERRNMMTDSNPKLRKKKQFSDVALPFQMQGETKFGQEVLPLPSKPQKVLKRGFMVEDSPVLRQTERLISDSLTDSGSEYCALRRKYLLLEEESFVLGRDLREIKAEVKTLENEKFVLLNQLVVLEGLIDPSELEHHGGL